MKRHPQTKEILKEMERWAKKKKWSPIYDTVIIKPFNKFFGSHYDRREYLMGFYQGEPPHLTEALCIHFIPTTCEGNAVYAYCARPGVGKVIKHKIGNCPLVRK